MAINLPQNTSAEEIILQLNRNFRSVEFTPEHEGTGVSTAYGRYQRIGDLIFVSYSFSGTSCQFNDSKYIVLPTRAYTKANNAVAHILPSSMFVFATTNGDVLDTGHQVANTDRIAPDNQVTANDMVVTGLYWSPIKL